jgi:hypothetical protein
MSTDRLQYKHDGLNAFHHKGFEAIFQVNADKPWINAPIFFRSK